MGEPDPDAANALLQVSTGNQKATRNGGFELTRTKRESKLFRHESRNGRERKRGNNFNVY